MLKNLNFSFILKKTLTLAFASSLLLLTSCSKQKDKDEMNFKELKKRSLASLERNKLDDAAECLEEIIRKHPEHKDAAKHKLMLAETYFKQGNHASAEKLYSNFAAYYPSNKKAEYARYQAIKSQYYQTLRTDCDQTATQETIAHCQGYLNNPSNKQYIKDVQDIMSTCQNKLINKEIYVYNFYLKRKKFDAAQNRLSYLRDHFLDKQKNLEPRLLYLECKLAHKQKNVDSLEKTLEELISKYPNSHYTHMTKSLITKSNKFVF